MKTGYVHPYHTETNPLVYSHYNYMKTLFEAVGPEQVSPHYESLSRSRRGLLFMFGYIGTIVSISRLGGWSHNEWIRGMVFHHEFLITFYLGYIETRHFTWLPGPKFTIFYNTYARYETQQLTAQWADMTEELQMRHLVHTKQQMEYVRLNREYDFVKKRAMVNFLSNSRTEVENHFHNRAHSMLSSIERYEQGNLKGLLNGIGKGALDKVNAALNDSTTSAEIKEASFQSALTGIRDGAMTYKEDPLMPILTSEIALRVNSYKALNAAEEGKLLSLDADQKKVVSEADKREKTSFLAQQPSINNPGVKANPKFLQFAEVIKASA
jgi:hypothetical protein